MDQNLFIFSVSILLDYIGIIKSYFLCRNANFDEFNNHLRRTYIRDPSGHLFFVIVDRKWIPVVFNPVLDLTQVLIWRRGDLEILRDIETLSLRPVLEMKSRAFLCCFYFPLGVLQSRAGAWQRSEHVSVRHQRCTVRPSSIDFLSMSESSSIQNWLFSASSVEDTITFSAVLECQSALMNNESLTFCYCYLPLVTSQTVKRCLSALLANSNVRY